MHLAVIPILLLLLPLVALERRVHRALFVRRHGDPDEYRLQPAAAPAPTRRAA